MVRRRYYVTNDDVTNVIDITDTQEVSLNRLMSEAEAFIDNYCGYQEKFLDYTIPVEPTSVVGNVIYDTATQTQLHVTDGYFALTEIEIIAGTGNGQYRFIESSSKADKSVTVRDAWDIQPDTTSRMIIRQFAKFPRNVDVYISRDSTQFLKSYPQAIKDAVLAQIEFMVNMGDEYFNSDKGEYESESIGNYSYSKGSLNTTGSDIKLIAPKARTLLRGIANQKGRVLAENPTEL